MEVVYILALRQLKRYARARARIIGSLGQPLLFLVALGFGFGRTYERAGGGNYIQFLAPGIISMGILFTAVFSGIEIIWDRQFGFLKETLVAPVSRLQIVLGRNLGGRSGCACSRTHRFSGMFYCRFSNREHSAPAGHAHLYVSHFRLVYRRRNRHWIDP